MTPVPEEEVGRLREALAWAVGFIQCAHPNAERDYEDMRNAMRLAAGGPGMFGEFHRLSCLAEANEGEAALYRRGYDLIGACDISNYLARCAEAGKLLEGDCTFVAEHRRGAEKTAKRPKRAKKLMDKAGPRDIEDDGSRAGAPLSD